MKAGDAALPALMSSDSKAVLNAEIVADNGCRSQYSQRLISSSMSARLKIRCIVTVPAGRCSHSFTMIAM
jgi:hypothetical protein